DRPNPQSERITGLERQAVACANPRGQSWLPAGKARTTSTALRTGKYQRPTLRSALTNNSAGDLGPARVEKEAESCGYRSVNLTGAFVQVLCCLSPCQFGCAYDGCR